VHQRLPEQFNDTTLILGLDHDQGGIGADQCAQVLQFAHAGSVLRERHDSKADAD